MKQKAAVPASTALQVLGLGKQQQMYTALAAWADSSSS
jgi:hypothetical protein